MANIAIKTFAELVQVECVAARTGQKRYADAILAIESLTESAIHGKAKPNLKGGVEPTRPPQLNRESAE